MDPADKSPTIIVHEDSDSLEELSEYLDVLSSSARLRILKFLEKKPRDARGISKEIETSYENTKKHLDKLLKDRRHQERWLRGVPAGTGSRCGPRHYARGFSGGLAALGRLPRGTGKAIESALSRFRDLLRTAFQRLQAKEEIGNDRSRL